MKVQIVLIDDNGITFEGSADLSPRASSSPARRGLRSVLSSKASSVSVNFSTPMRAFVKNHARQLSGPQKFALLVAYLSKGIPETPVASTDIVNNWNRMSGLLGGRFNRAHSTRAKDHGWVDSPKHGVYVIQPGWEVILNAK
jgi:hypothetical protein